MPTAKPIEAAGPASLSLDFTTLRDAYAAGTLRPREVLAACIDAIERNGSNPVWISRVDTARLFARADELDKLDAASAARLPLFGIPFAVKDNIDVAGMPTTAGCPAYAYTPPVSATVVQKLLDAGAILLGKTNLDQFATGLTGTRSPFGACRNAFDPTYIAGGSSSGSAVAVAAGMVSFALGTDTAGSGRVPAAFNNIVGLKPSRGLISAAGVVPACQSLDCVSIFALTVADAREVLRAADGFDARDPYSRPDRSRHSTPGAAFRFGVPRADQLEFFHDRDAERQFSASVERMRAIGGTPVEFDFSPFARVAQMLYGGPWTAERYAAIRDFLVGHSYELLPVTRDIILSAARHTAADAFAALHELQGLKQETAGLWAGIDCMLVPSTPTIYGIGEVEADPFQLNTNLGYYTNFVNLLELCAVAVPSGFRDDGLPCGVTLIAPALHEDPLCDIAARCHQAAQVPLGATGNPMPAMAPAERKTEASTAVEVQLAVVGAHLSGEPLNHQLTRRGGKLLRKCLTASGYRLYLLPDTAPPKPGLRRTDEDGLNGIEVEVWSLGIGEFGEFAAEVPPPLGIGSVTLEDGAVVKGFICEGHALEHALDISHFGGWKNYLAHADGGRVRKQANGRR
jgi:allophanate hydrolase